MGAMAMTIQNLIGVVNTSLGKSASGTRQDAGSREALIGLVTPPISTFRIAITKSWGAWDGTMWKSLSSQFLVTNGLLQVMWSHAGGVMCEHQEIVHGSSASYTSTRF